MHPNAPFIPGPLPILMILIFERPLPFALLRTQDPPAAPNRLP
jgi:hypothetical protein